MSNGEAGAPDRDPIAALETSREQGMARLDPVGFSVIEALARRAAAQQGEARERLMLRIVELLARHVAKPPIRSAAKAPNEHVARQAVLAGLSELVDRLGRSPGSDVPPPSPPCKSAVRDSGAPKAVRLSHVAPQASRRNAVAAFKGTWSRLRAEQRLRQVLAQVPAMAGPLNSSNVINRALQAMRELSPEYLDAFMLHVDTLLWLEQASGGNLSLRAAAPAESGRGRDIRTARKA